MPSSRRIAVPAIEAAVVVISLIAAIVAAGIVIALGGVERAGALRTTAAAAPARDVIEPGVAREIAVCCAATEGALTAAAQRVQRARRGTAGMPPEGRTDAA